MYHLVSGEYPFETPDLSDKICTQWVSFDGPRWSVVTPHAKDLIRKLLTKRPEERCTARAALDHAFFAGIQAAERRASRLDVDLVRGLSQY